MTETRGPASTMSLRIVSGEDDPDENLRGQMVTARVIRDGESKNLELDARDLADLVLRMDCWLRLGGELPKEWQIPNGYTSLTARLPKGLP